MTVLSKTQIDRLGDRLRKGNLSDDDLQLLDHYRKSFEEAYETVINMIFSQLGLKPTGRPAKSTSSIIEKLNRESIRLSQIQDIAGCRVIVSDIHKQEAFIQSLKNIFPSANIIDRRIKPSYGYRSVHIVIKIDQKLIEVQIRTNLQHHWAELSEKISDKIDPAIKYGGGDKSIQEILLNLSTLINQYESAEDEFLKFQENYPNREKSDGLQNAVMKLKSEIQTLLKTTKLFK